MATSGTTTFNLSIDEIVEEAYERCGLEVRTGYDAETARRSLNIMFADWANKGVNLWKVEQVVQNLAQLSSTSAVATYPVGTITATVVASGSFSLGETITGSTSGTTAEIITKPKALLLPKDLDEMRDPRDKFKPVEHIQAAAGVKIASPDLEGVLPGSTLYATSDSSEIDGFKNLIEDEMQSDFINT